MASIETTELKLKTTPTAGGDAARSPYYRRLVSEGYKGFLQGSIGGGALYGALGLAVGAIIAPFAIPAAGAAAFFLIPALGTIGLVKGASTFGNIGSVAAINAAAADMSEQRRYLLDRYYDLPEGPEGDREAAAIREQLTRQSEVTNPPPFIRWKTVAICGAIGAVVGLALLSPVGLGLATSAAIKTMVGGQIAAVAAGLGSAAITGIMTAVGALAGATIGIDRYYIRKWFDHTEGAVYSNYISNGLLERSQQIESLKEAARSDEETKRRMENGNNAAHIDASTQVRSPQVTAEAPAPAPIATTAQLDKPDTKISSAVLQSRLADIQKAMEIPAL